MSKEGDNDSNMLKMLKAKYPEKYYDFPSNIGKKWNESEEQKLLEELAENLDIETIAKSHNRSIGGINARCKEIAYKLHLQNIPIENIILQTRLDENNIKEIIEKKQQSKKKITVEVKKLDNQQIDNTNTINNDICEIKKDLCEIKQMLKEILNQKTTV